MTKKGASLLALVTTMIYLLSQVFIMLKYQGEQGVMALDNSFMSFLLLQLPKILLGFGLVIYFLVGISEEPKK